MLVAGLSPQPPRSDIPLQSNCSNSLLVVRTLMMLAYYHSEARWHPVSRPSSTAASVRP